MKSLVVWLLAFVTLAGANGAIFGGGLGQLGGETTLHVTPWGNDAAASRGKPDKPWLTLSNAVESARWGDTIIIDSGVHTNTAKIHGSGLTAPINISLKTNLAVIGYGARLHWPTQLTGIRLYQCSNVVLAGFSMSQDKATQPNGLMPHDVGVSQTNNGVFGMIEVAECENITFRDLHLSGGYDHGILGDPPPQVGSTTNGILVEGCTFIDIGSIPANGWQDGAAVVMCSGWRVVNNQFRNVNRGVELFNYAGMWNALPPAVISGNVFVNTRNEAILIERASCTVSDNTIFRETGWTNWGAVTPIIFKGVGGAVCSGNVVDNGTDYSIYGSYVTNLSFSGNVLKRSNRAIALEDESRGVSIVGNTFVDNQVAAVCLLQGRHVDLSIIGNTGLNAGISADEWASFLLVQSGTATNVIVANNAARLAPALGKTFAYGLFGPTVTSFVASGNTWQGYSAGFTTNLAPVGGSFQADRVLEFPTNRVNVPPVLSLGSFAYWNSNGVRLWKCWNTNGTTVCAQTP